MAKASADDAAAAHTNARIAILFIVERRGTRTDVGFGIRYLASKKQERMCYFTSSGVWLRHL
jgi:hypothetical protein